LRTCSHGLSDHLHVYIFPLFKAVINKILFRINHWLQFSQFFKLLGIKSSKLFRSLFHVWLFTSVRASRSLEERTLVYFSNNEPSLLKAYVDSGEGIDRAGGFAVQVESYRRLFVDVELKFVFVGTWGDVDQEDRWRFQ
jgi:hypothetical protein